MACIDKLEQDAAKNVWVGTSIRTGQTKVFRTLDDYKQYTKSLETKGTWCADVEPIENIAYKPYKETTPTGFLQFRPRDPVTQARFDAMSKTWEGVEATEKAIADGLYDLDKAETTRQELRTIVPQIPSFQPKPKSTDRDIREEIQTIFPQVKNCSIQ